MLWRCLEKWLNEAVRVAREQIAIMGVRRWRV
jgi:hypothetical protein